MLIRRDKVWTKKKNSIMWLSLCTLSPLDLFSSWRIICFWKHMLWAHCTLTNTTEQKSPQKSFIFITLPLQVSCMSCPQNWCLRLFVLSMLFRLIDCLFNTLESIKKIEHFCKILSIKKIIANISLLGGLIFPWIKLIFSF